MPRNKTSGSLALASFEDIFNIVDTSPDIEQITQILLTDLFAPEFHPFQVTDDEAMERLTESVAEYGVREPGLARSRKAGGYELLCGNRRRRACERAGIATMPIIIRELDDSSAALAMVDSNLEQRERILPSERAWAYRVMLDALDHNGTKREKHSHEIVTERTGVTKSQLFRTIRLTELIAPMIDMVDTNKLAFNPAVELSYLSAKEQATVMEVMTAHEVKPSLSQAVRLKKLKQGGKLTESTIESILSETKKSPKDEPASSIRYRKYFPPEYSQKEMDVVIVKLLKNWKSSNER